ncbi:MAG: hypothetical protein L6Q95_03645 [Planctomycetes bacterium]|nr:hypothetical protein [Planctomycetota bacterium]
MKQILQGKTGILILSAAAGLVVAVAAWKLFDLGTRLEVNAAVREIARNGSVAKARTTLELLDNRAFVLEKLSEAVEDDSHDVRGKSNLLSTLTMFNQPRALRRALDSKSVTTQRAACSLLWGDPELKTRCGEIALAWLKDPGADDRASAASICGHLDLGEAQPVLLEIVARDPTTASEQVLFMRALAGIKDPKPPALVERLFGIASSEGMDKDIRGIALESLQRIKEGPRDRVLELSIGILADANASPILRSKAALGLREFPEDRAWQALEAVLLSEGGRDEILQRNCLYALGQMNPADPALARRYVDRLRQLLVDRRVYGNPYYAIRVDVATALAALYARDPITLDIMGDYLVDEDPKDKEHLVRQEAWLTLWTLTGTRLPDLPEPELFMTPPQPFPDPLQAREYFFRRAHYRPGITMKQSAMVAKIAGDLPRMQKTRQQYQSLRAQILEQWRIEEEARKARAAGEGPSPGSVGPEPPKEEEKGPGEEGKPN